MSKLSIIALIVAALLSGLIKTGFGIGAGFFLTPLLSNFTGAKEALGIMTPFMLFTDFITIFIFWRKWDWHTLLLLGPGCCLGTVAGAYFISWASPSATEITIGTTAIIFSLVQMCQGRIHTFQLFEFKTWHFILASIFAGFASSIAHSGGIILTIFLITLCFSKERFVSTLACILLFADITKCILFNKLQILKGTMMIHGIFLLPAMLLGSWLGYKLTKKLNQKRYNFYMNLIVLISGILLLIEPKDFFP
ncbi:sulfite exporter taue/safe [Lucifera butyrica]|uniref:Probable membrane transporter protein n=1 Tax=Lucifera butyrica TaxID=1351585 RepID=A0A498R8K4_9FIRM|nr:sulfite exporter TauE/SafE family protein [Lucifera butyrica]VBB07305.1 sulfite exporter taue/safe [Lucifera butyrica]